MDSTTWIPLQCLRVIQYDPKTIAEVPIIRPKAELSSVRTGQGLVFRSEFKDIVNDILKDCTSEYPTIIGVAPENERINDRSPLTDIVDRMRSFWQTGSSRRTRHNCMD